MLKIPFNQNSKNSGFTLIELLMVTSIVIILSIILVVNYEFGGYKLALQRSAHMLAQDIRRASEMAMSAREIGGEVPAGGYGIEAYSYESATTSATFYVLFADNNNTKQFEESEDDMIEKVYYETNVSVFNICVEPQGCSGRLSVVFSPPDPTIDINKPEYEEEFNIYGYADLRSDKVEGMITVRINNAGLIEILQD